MEVRIGVVHSLKEVEVNLDSNVDRDELRGRIDSLLASGAGVLWLTDKNGREVAVPVPAITYVDLGRSVGQRSIGFSA